MKWFALLMDLFYGEHTKQKKTSATTTHYSPVTKAYLIEIIEMLKQKKIMLEEHQKHIMDL